MKKQVAFLALAALGLLVGCSSDSVNTVENARKFAAMQVMRDARVDTDLNLADDFGVVRLNAAENAAGILRVQAEMENFTRSRMTINAMIEWYDETAMRIDTAGGGWQQYVFEPRESRSIVFTAPSREARDFRLKMLNVDD